MAKAELKTKENKASVSAFLNSIEDVEKRSDTKKVLALMKKQTGMKPKMWGDSIVGFGLFPYKYASGREGEWFMVGLSPRKQALTLYMMLGFDKSKTLMKKLGKYKTGKSCLYVKKLEDIDLSILEKLVKQNVDHFKKGGKMLGC